MKDLSLHLMDLLQNSIAAGANLIEVVISANRKKDILLLRIDDNGKGMDPKLAARIDDPFVTTRNTRKIGLGIPMLKASANLAEGTLRINSIPGKGTTVEATFKISHIDRLPLGDIAQTIVNTLAAYPEVDLVLKLENGRDLFIMKTSEIKERLGEVPVSEFSVLFWLKDFINEGVKTIFGGVLDEIIG